MHRFYAPALRENDETASLDEDDASHLVRVLRLVPGSEVRIFNGGGVERVARVELADKRGVVLRVIGSVDPVPELPFALTLAQAVLKGDGMDDVVRDAVMLGVTRIVPLLTGRSESSRAQLERTRRLDRWRRVAVSSAKQCGRAVVPPIGPIQSLEAVLKEGPGVRYALVEPRATASVIATRELAPGPPADGGVVLVGPEGGWTLEELRLSEREGARLVTLGALTLRADAAARVALPVLRHIWGTL
jgi:16S rRNA (uracil1498-N3)-methyltransferase